MKNFFAAVLLIIGFESFAQHYVLDNTFGVNGVKLYDGNTFFPSKVILEGGSYYLISTDRLCKVNYNGSIDTAFGNSGFISLVFSNYTFSFSDIKYINNSIYLLGEATTSGGKDLFIAKVTLSGQLDTAFGNGGMAIYNFGMDEKVSDFTVDASGKLFCIGTKTNATTYDSRLMHFKLNPDGTLDYTYDASGFKELLVNTKTSGKAIFPFEGNFIVVGIATRYNTVVYNELLVSKIDSNGSIITGFGSNGSKVKALSGGMSITLNDVYLLNNDIHVRYFYAYSFNGQGSSVISFNLLNDTQNYHFGTYYSSFMKPYNDGIYISGIDRCNYEPCSRDAFLTKKNFSGVTDTNFSVNGTYTYTSPSPPYYSGSDEALPVFVIDEGNGKILMGGKINRNNTLTMTRETGFGMIRIEQGTLSSDTFEKDNLKIYPNPFSDYVSIDSEVAIKEIEIYNALGEKLNRQSDFDKNTSLLDLSWIKHAGVYVIRITSEDDTVTYKKIIKK